MAQGLNDLNTFLAGVGWDKYIWGEIIYIYRVGEYAIIKYVPDHGSRSRILYHPFINRNNDWHDTECSYSTLDKALIGVISYKYDGYNSNASEYFGRMVGMTDEN